MTQEAKGLSSGKGVTSGKGVSSSGERRVPKPRVQLPQNGPREADVDETQALSMETIGARVPQ